MKLAKFLSHVVGAESSGVFDYEIADINGLRFGIVVVDDVAYSISTDSESEYITDACRKEGWLLP
jgi:hypothetical protein